MVTVGEENTVGLLAKPATTAQIKRQIEDQDEVFEHRCALEHSQHFKDEA